MKKTNRNNDKRNKGKICLTNAQEIYLNDKELAIEWINQAIVYFKGEQQSLCDLAQCYCFKALLLYNENKIVSRFYFKESIKAHILGSKRDLYKTNTYYKFVSVKDSTTLNSILNQIRLTHPSNFNDPMDCPIATSPQNGIPDIDLFNSLRVGCFGVVTNNEFEYYLNASKWSYYGDSHRGICIEYNFSELNFNNQFALMDKVSYEKEYTTQRGIVGSGLLTKSLDYEHENEWRIIWYRESLATHDPVYIKILPSMINKIFLGFKCPEYISTNILDFKNKNPHIQIYKVQPSNDNFYQLCATELI